VVVHGSGAESDGEFSGHMELRFLDTRCIIGIEV
jgi:hypothetical protein